ncbi:WD repeat-containing protein 92 [Willisornis vidua]|uniref:WD repeat-containing protein 92 n=1 Tax=Willisornis vidua TaxID=1566151 RepID=A0ABQ9D0Y6_9PASS|nr:WD repeat-containing protein 92 [Willisornis vidua]
MSAAPALERPQVVSHAQQSLSYTVFDCKWVPRSARLLCLGSAARGTGVVQLYELRGARLELLREIEKPKPIKCGTFGATSLQQRYLATGDFDGNLNIWNLEAPEIPVYSVKGHKEIINSIDGVGGLGIGEGAPEIVTGSRDGTVKVWDPRQKDTPVANMEPVQGESKRDCWTVAFGNAYNQEERVVCAGYDNGDIKLFDLKTMSLRWETNIKNGVCSVEFDRKDINMNKLVATSLEGKFHVFDMRTQHPTKGFASVSEKRPPKAGRLYNTPCPSSGVALYVRERFACLELNDGDDWVESLWVTIKGKANKADILVGGCYRPTIQDEEADEIFYKQLGEVSPLLILVLIGDFNLPDMVET